MENDEQIYFVFRGPQVVENLRTKFHAYFNTNDIDVNMNVVYKPYNNSFFSLNFKYN